MNPISRSLGVNDKSDNSNWFTSKTMAQATVGLTAAVGLGALTFCAIRYRVAGPTEYIVRTGYGIKDISIDKRALQLPFQTYRRLNMEPVTFSVEVDAMSKQRIPFRMPSVWTIGPENNIEALTKYSRLLIDKGSKGFQDTVEGIIQGEARILTANMELDELFHDRESFKKTVTSSVNQILDDLGLTIYNANIAELADLDDHNQYFSEQKKRALQKVNQEARVHVAEAMKDGESGEKFNQAQTRQKVSQYEKEAKLVENDRQKEISESDKNLAVAQAIYQKEQDIATAESRAAAEQRKWELQQEVERTRKEQEVERLRATEWTAANVNAEVAIRKAEGEAAALKLRAEAELYAKQKEAEGILALREAEAKGLERLMNAAGGGEDLAKYLLISQRQLPELAEKQAEALRGLQPKVNVWSTGPQNDSLLSETLTGLFKTGMPLFEGLKSQTGYDFIGSAGIKKENSVVESKE